MAVDLAPVKRLPRPVLAEIKADAAFKDFLVAFTGCAVRDSPAWPSAGAGWA